MFFLQFLHLLRVLIKNLDDATLAPLSVLSKNNLINLHIIQNAQGCQGGIIQILDHHP